MIQKGIYTSKKKRNTSIKCLYFFFIGFLLLSCKEKENRNIAPHKVFRLHLTDNLNSLDPAFSKDQSSSWMVNQIFNGLVQLDDSLKVKPDLAETWSISSDGLLYDFKLRSDVFFHKHPLFGKDSTRRVTARDFVYSFNRLKDPVLAAPGAWIMNFVDRVEVLNENHLRVKLKNPFPPFLGLLSMKYASVVPLEMVQHYGQKFGQNPIGTGPFYKKWWEEGDKLILARNPNYYEKNQQGRSLPLLERVIVGFLPDKYMSFLLLKQGKIDMLSGLESGYKDELLTPDGRLQKVYDNKFKHIKQPFLNTEYLCFWIDDKDEKKVDQGLRKAINYGLDRVKMIRYLRNNIGIPATGGIIPKGLIGYNPDAGYKYNIAKARMHMKAYKTKYPNKRPRIRLAARADYTDICQYIQSELANIGLEILVDIKPPSVIKQERAQGKLPFFRASWIADYPDAENYLSLFLTKNASPSGPNYSHYSNAQYDALYRKAIEQTDIKQRAILYEQMDALMMEQAPVVPLFYDEVNLFLNSKVMNFKGNPINMLNLKNVYKKP